MEKADLNITVAASEENPDNAVIQNDLPPAANGAQAQTKQVAAAGGNTVGKFKDVGSLLKAYGELEAEFTRRSQRLKQLEGTDTANSDTKTEAGDPVERDNHAGAAVSGGGADTDAGNADKTGEKISFEKMIETETGRFLQTHPEAARLSREISGIAAAAGDYSAGFLERAYLSCLKDKTRAPQGDSEILKAVQNSSSLKEHIIKEYLNGIKNGERVTLLSELGANVVMPPKKPSSITEAGDMAKQLLKKI